MTLRIDRSAGRWLGAFLLRLGLGMATSAVPTGAQTHPVPAAATGPYRIAGTVVDALSGNPVQRALVSLLTVEDMHNVATVMTDAQGHFAFEGLAAGKFPLSAAKRGFRTSFYDDHDGFFTAMVTGPEQDTSQVIFQLVPSAILRGVVSGDGGDPVEGARVMLFSKLGHRGSSEQIVQTGTQVTDDTGAYEFAGLARGEYLIAVSAQPWYALHRETLSQTGDTVEGNSELDVAYPVTYFDSTTQEASATPISLTAGSREEANINLHAVPALHFTLESPHPTDGRSRPALQQIVFGVPMAGVSVGYLDPIGTGVDQFQGLAPGHYEVTTGDPPRFIEMEATESGAIDPNGGAAMMAVSGLLRMSDGSKPPEEAHPILQARGSSPNRANLLTAAHGGRFDFEAVPPGTWSATVESAGQMLPAIAIAIEGEAARPGNTIRVQDRPLEITVILGAGGPGHLDGFAQKQGKGFAGALIELLPANLALLEALGRRDQSDSDGSFSLADVIPGNYTLVAIENGWDLDWSDPQVMARYLPKGTSVTVTNAPGARVRLAEPVAVQSP
jgi:Carboxypeptidase regulatory-like domain